METPITDDQRLLELREDVEAYLLWIERTDAELRLLVHEQCLRLKHVNRTMIKEPVW